MKKVSEYPVECILSAINQITFSSSRQI